MFGIRSSPLKRPHIHFFCSLEVVPSFISELLIGWCLKVAEIHCVLITLIKSEVKIKSFAVGESIANIFNYTKVNEILIWIKSPKLLLISF